MLKIASFCGACAPVKIPSVACSLFDAAVQTVGEESTRSGGTAQVHDGQHLGRCAREGNIVASAGNDGLQSGAILHTEASS